MMNDGDADDDDDDYDYDYDDDWWPIVVASKESTAIFVVSSTICYPFRPHYYWHCLVHCDQNDDPMPHDYDSRLDYW